jgi:hypothetical protein
MADFAKRLAAAAKRNNNDNIGNTRNVWRVNLSNNKIAEEQRAIEEFERIQAALRHVTRRLKQCESSQRTYPQKMREAEEYINYLMTKANESNLSKKEISELRGQTAELSQMKNTLRSCQIEMAGLLEQKQQLNTEEFFQKKWHNEASNMSPFNKPNSRKVTYRNKHLPSMVGGRGRHSRYRRKTKKNRS